MELHVLQVYSFALAATPLGLKQHLPEVTLIASCCTHISVQAAGAVPLYAEQTLIKILRE